MKKIIAAFLIFCASTAFASPYHDSRFFGGEWYFSWGFSREVWSGTDINVNQPALGNSFTVHNVAGMDGWMGNPFRTVFGAQYNIRIGRFVDAAHTWAVELSFDHSKYTSIPNQLAYLDGIVNSQTVGAYQVLSPTYFTYLLHNGLNHLMIDAVKRMPIHGEPNQTRGLSALFKIGAGVLLPHSENTIFGFKNDVGPKSWGNCFGFHHGWWQFGGWTIGAEVGVRYMIYKPVYIELLDKEAFSNISNIPVYRGRAYQTLWMNEVILNLGFST